MVLVIEHLHKQDIIYREYSPPSLTPTHRCSLKPENVLIDSEGYIRIADFGLSKKGIKGNVGARSICGTPEYLAPEIIFKMGHGKAVDWWTLGAILYELLTGVPPFYSSSQDKLFEQIKFRKPKFPPGLSDECQSLLESFFQKNPETRIGSAGGSEEIKRHPWFASMDWMKLLSKKLAVPFVPMISTETDLSHFDPEFT